MLQSFLDTVNSAVNCGCGDWLASTPADTLYQLIQAADLPKNSPLIVTAQPLVEVLMTLDGVPRATDFNPGWTFPYTEVVQTVRAVSAAYRSGWVHIPANWIHVPAFRGITIPFNMNLGRVTDTVYSETAPPIPLVAYWQDEVSNYFLERDDWQNVMNDLLSHPANHDRNDLLSHPANHNQNGRNIARFIDNGHCPIQ